MKKLMLLLLASIMLSSSVFADTFTTNLNLTKPGRGSPNWDTKINSNSDKIDAAYGTILSNTADMSVVEGYNGTFNSTTGTTITLSKTVSSANDYQVNIVATSRAGAIGDIYVTDKTTTNFKVKCSEANTTDTFTAVVHFDETISAYGEAVRRRYIVSPLAAGTDHGDDTVAGTIADVENDVISGISATMVLPGNHSYELLQDLTLSSTTSVTFDRGAKIDTDFSIQSASYQWCASGSGSSEYWLAISTGNCTAPYADDNPSISEPEAVYEANDKMGQGTLGSLQPGSWGWGNNDSLSFNTVYVELADSSDPDVSTPELEAAYTLTINGTIQAGAYQIFDGNGVVVFGATDKVYTEWWGATGDGTTSDTTAFDKAIVATRDTGIEIHLLPNTYRVGSLDIVGPGAVTPGNSGPSFVGHGDNSTWINANLNGGTIIQANTSDYIFKIGIDAAGTATSTATDIMTDSTASFATNVFVGMTITNTTTSSTGVVVANTATQVYTTSGLLWTSTDAYTIRSDIYRTSFKNITFDGDTSTDDSAERASGCIFQALAGFTHIEDCVFVYGDYGIVTKRSDRLTMTKCAFYENTYGVYWDETNSELYDSSKGTANASGISLIDIHHRRNDYNLYLHDDRVDFQMNIRGGYWTGAYKGDVYITGGAKSIVFDGVNFENTTDGIITGTHTGANGAATLQDTSKSWTNDEWIGRVIRNDDDGSACVITDNDATTITCTLVGGTNNDWSNTGGDIDDYTLLAKPALFQIGIVEADGTTTAGSSGLTMNDSGANWATNELIGFILYNDTDTTEGVITGNTATSITVGSGISWSSGEDYSIAPLHIGIDNIVIQNCMFQDNNNAAIDRSSIISVLGSSNSADPSIASLVFSNNVMRNMANSEVRGVHGGSGNSATLTTSVTMTTDEYVGRVVKNVTDNSWGKVISNNNTASASVVTATLEGGTDNDWDVGDEYALYLVDPVEADEVTTCFWKNNAGANVRPPNAYDVWKTTAESSSIGVSNSVEFGTRMYSCPITKKVQEFGNGASFTARLAEVGGVYTNQEDSPAQTNWVLPAITFDMLGWSWQFINVTGQKIRVAPNAADGFLAGSAVNKYVDLSSNIGDVMEITCVAGESGQNWSAVALEGSVTHEP